VPPASELEYGKLLWLYAFNDSSQAIGHQFMKNKTVLNDMASLRKYFRLGLTGGEYKNDAIDALITADDIQAAAKELAKQMPDGHWEQLLEGLFAERMREKRRNYNLSYRELLRPLAKGYYQLSDYITSQALIKSYIRKLEDENRIWYTSMLFGELDYWKAVVLLSNPHIDPRVKEIEWMDIVEKEALKFVDRTNSNSDIIIKELVENVFLLLKPQMIRSINIMLRIIDRHLYDDQQLKEWAEVWAELSVETDALTLLKQRKHDVVVQNIFAKQLAALPMESAPA